MKRNSKLLGALLASITGIAVVPACYRTEPEAVYATYESTPPAPREEYVVYRPGYTWIHGNWYHDYNYGWRWRSGYYVRERPGYVYTPGYWERRRNHYVWVPGSWRRSNVVIRRYYY